jgi:long-chain fatty acid transport protein
MKRTPFAAALFVLTLPAAASASGYYVPKVGGDTAGPTTANGSALFWNPAAMSLIDGHSVFIEPQLAWRKNQYTPSEPGQAPSDTTRWNIIPAAAATFTLHDRVKAGIGIFFPYGLGNDFVPRDGSSRFSIIYADMRSMFVMPSLSVDVVKNDKMRFAFAAGLVIARTSVDHYKALDSGSLLPGSTPRERIGDVLAEQEARTLFSGAGNTFGFDVGLLFQPIPTLTLGASYIHSMKANVKGTLQSYMPPTNQAAAQLRTPMEATANFPLPATLRFGADFRFLENRAMVKFQTDWSRWSEFDTQTVTVTEPAGVSLNLDQQIPRNFKNTVGFRAGGSYFVNDWAEVLLAGGGESGAVPDATMAPDINDSSLIGVSVGPKFYIGAGRKNYLNKPELRTGLFGKNDALVVHALWNGLFYNKRTVKGTLSRPSTDGTYESTVHLICLNLDYRF